MSGTIDFYFDMVSPFSYLAHLKLPDIADRHGRTINYCPIDIPQAKIAAGNYGPSNREVPAKIKVIGADLQRWARRYGVTLVFPKGFDCTRWNVGALFAANKGAARDFVTSGYQRIWGQGIDPADDNELAGAARDAGLDPADLIAYVDSSLGRTDFRQACVVAHRRGIFGAPIMVADDEMFWGNDRLDFLEEYISENRPAAATA